MKRMMLFVTAVSLVLSFGVADATRINNVIKGVTAWTVTANFSTCQPALLTIQQGAYADTLCAGGSNNPMTASAQNAIGVSCASTTTTFPATAANCNVDCIGSIGNYRTTITCK